MNEVSEAIARWLVQKRRTDRFSAAVIAMLALGSGAAVFLLTTVVVYTILAIVCGTFLHSVRWLGLVAAGLTAGLFVRIMKARKDERQLESDPVGYWILKDICSFCPRLILEGLRQVRCCGELGELNVAACARALAYLAAQDAAVNWQNLVQHCPEPPWPLFREQLSLLDGVLFLGEEAERVTLMDPFRLRLRWMLGQDQKQQEPTRPRPEPAPRALPVTDPEKLSAYQILGLSPSASVVEIKTAYRKRVKACHPDLFSGMDEHAKALAERWTRALNTAYASLNPRHGVGAKPGYTGRR